MLPSQKKKTKCWIFLATSIFLVNQLKASHWPQSINSQHRNFTPVKIPPSNAGHSTFSWLSDGFAHHGSQQNDESAKLGIVIEEIVCGYFKIHEDALDVPKNARKKCIAYAYIHHYIIPSAHTIDEITASPHIRSPWMNIKLQIKLCFNLLTENTVEPYSFMEHWYRPQWQPMSLSLM